MANETASFVELAGPSTKNRYTEEERNNHCIEWKKSGLSMQEYSRRFGIAISSLSKWLNEDKKISLSQGKVETLQTTSTHQSVEIILTSGIRLRFSRASIAELLRFIRALESCG